MIFLFDCFGVVVDWKSEYVIPFWAKYAKISEADAKSALAEVGHLADTGQISMDELWQRFGEKCRVSPAGLEHIFMECFKKKARLDEDVVKIVKSLHDPCVLSNQWTWHTEYLKKIGWFSYFKRVFISNELNYCKPDPRVYLAVIKELGVPPDSIVLIDDKKENIDGALKCGMKGIVFSSADQLRGDLEKLYNIKFNQRKHGAA